MESSRLKVDAKLPHGDKSSPPGGDVKDDDTLNTLDLATQDLLAGKLQEGFCLLENVCPSCSTPLVVNPLSSHCQSDPSGIEHKQSDDSMKSSTHLSQHSTSTGNLRQVPHQRPIRGVAYCVPCQAHVILRASDVDILEQYEDRHGKGSIFVGSISRTGSSVETGPCPTTEKERSVPDSVDPVVEKSAMKKAAPLPLWQTQQLQVLKVLSAQRKLQLGDSKGTDRAVDAAIKSPTVREIDVGHDMDQEEISLLGTIDTTRLSNDTDDTNYKAMEQRESFDDPSQDIKKVVRNATSSSTMERNATKNNVGDMNHVDQDDVSKKEFCVCYKSATSLKEHDAPLVDTVLSNETMVELAIQQTAIYCSTANTPMATNSKASAGNVAFVLPDHATRRRIAIKVLAAKLVQGFVLDENHTPCNQCGMPLVVDNNVGALCSTKVPPASSSYDCYVCRALVKRHKQLQEITDRTMDTQHAEQQVICMKCHQPSETTSLSKPVYPKEDDRCQRLITLAKSASDEAKRPLSPSTRILELISTTSTVDLPVQSENLSATVLTHEHRASHASNEKLEILSRGQLYTVSNDMQESRSLTKNRVIEGEDKRSSPIAQESVTNCQKSKPAWKTVPGTDISISHVYGAVTVGEHVDSKKQKLEKCDSADIMHSPSKSHFSVPVSSVISQAGRGADIASALCTPTVDDQLARRIDRGNDRVAEEIVKLKELEKVRIYLAEAPVSGITAEAGAQRRRDVENQEGRVDLEIVAAKEIEQNGLGIEKREQARLLTVIEQDASVKQKEAEDAMARAYTALKSIKAARRNIFSNTTEPSACLALLEKKEKVMKETPAIQEQWEIRRVEKETIVRRHLASGWTLSRHCCLGSECRGAILLTTGTISFCAVCGGGGCGTDAAYAAYSGLINENHQKNKELMIRQPDCVPCLASDGHKQVEVLFKQASFPAETLFSDLKDLQATFEANRDVVRKEIGKRMMRGWSLLDKTCPYCTMPLMTNSITSSRKECVLCGPTMLPSSHHGRKTLDMVLPKQSKPSSSQELQCDPFTEVIKSKSVQTSKKEHTQRADSTAQYGDVQEQELYALNGLNCSHHSVARSQAYAKSHQGGLPMGIAAEQLSKPSCTSSAKNKTCAFSTASPKVRHRKSSSDQINTSSKMQLTKGTIHRNINKSPMKEKADGTLSRRQQSRTFRCDTNDELASSRIGDEADSIFDHTETFETVGNLVSINKLPEDKTILNNTGIAASLDHKNLNHSKVKSNSLDNRTVKTKDYESSSWASWILPNGRGSSSSKKSNNKCDPPATKEPHISLIDTGIQECMLSPAGSKNSRAESCSPVRSVAESQENIVIDLSSEGEYATIVCDGIAGGINNASARGVTLFARDQYICSEDPMPSPSYSSYPSVYGVGSGSSKFVDHTSENNPMPRPRGAFQQSNRSERSEAYSSRGMRYWASHKVLSPRNRPPRVYPETAFRQRCQVPSEMRSAIPIRTVNSHGEKSHTRRRVTPETEKTAYLAPLLMRDSSYGRLAHHGAILTTTSSGYRESRTAGLSIRSTPYISSRDACTIVNIESIRQSRREESCCSRQKYQGGDQAIDVNSISSVEVIH